MMKYVKCQWLESNALDWHFKQATTFCLFDNLWFSLVIIVRMSRSVRPLRRATDSRALDHPSDEYLKNGLSRALPISVIIVALVIID